MEPIPFIKSEVMSPPGAPLFACPPFIKQEAPPLDLVSSHDEIMCSDFGDFVKDVPTSRTILGKPVEAL